MNDDTSNDDTNATPMPMPRSLRRGFNSNAAWRRGREGHRIGDSKPTLAARKASRRRQAKQAKASRRANR